jgi:DNA-directed RNA polymerase sigma subunit (sigma70/sigma32)
MKPTPAELEAEIGEKLMKQQPLSQAEVALLFGVSRNRIHELEHRALRKLKKAIEEDPTAMCLAEEIV